MHLIWSCFNGVDFNLLLLRGARIIEIGLHLRYYATFRVRKIESYFYKINTFLQKTTCTGLQAEQKFSRYIIYISFQFFGVTFAVSLLLLPKAPAFFVEKMLK